MIEAAEAAVVLPALTLKVVMTADRAAAAVIAVHSNDNTAQSPHELANHRMPQSKSQNQKQDAHRIRTYRRRRRRAQASMDFRMAGSAIFVEVCASFSKKIPTF